MIISVDSIVDDVTLNKIAQTDGIENARYISL